ncbi:glycoside hydrolase family 3 N-terminal domain-containing protein [Nonomuraea sp. NPDC050536]|uniref:glycoside hydrolase family 3 N-terminal domain-containing protein n=1 Tax=Nonomuraea sp. NPDC050536 TaxID=3364366 RepID=UPI0037C5A650
MRELVARCLMAGVPGTSLPAGLLDFCGGLILFTRNVASAHQVRELTAAARAARPDVLIAIDAEGGPGGHLRALRSAADSPEGLPGRMGNRALGRADDVALTRRAGAEIGAELAGLGINVDFAPCADLDSRADNPIIGARSFGADPALVARHVVAFASGLESQGVAACAKHFPGHGDTSADSHLELPVASLTPQDLVPFRAAADTGVPMMMSAHVSYPAVDAAPATLSRTVLTRLLREDVGFGGVLVTDALEMRAISDLHGFAEAAVLALAAGADLVLIAVGDADVAAVNDAVVAAVESRRLPLSRLEEAAARVTALAHRYP